MSNAENEKIYGVLGYVVKNLIENENSKNTLAVNIGSDNMNALGHQTVNKNGDITVINAMRHNGEAEQNSNGSLKIYNPIKVDYVDLEKNIIEEG